MIFLAPLVVIQVLKVVTNYSRVRFYLISVLARVERPAQVHLYLG